MSKEHAYAYEAGYRDGSVHYELEHCPACKNIADLQEALEENAKLRAERDEWRRVAVSKQDIIDHMRDANAENAKLREEVEQWHRLTAGIELPEYPITEFKPKDLERENAKLIELVRDMNKWLWNGADCTECPFTAECDLNTAFESDLHAHICIGWGTIHDRMRELGVGADA